ncbi:MAG TPA: phytanoyl-CoA dioxygenase family protein, partial [Elusimicrobiota bacterium]|nr:phytanoyl-CoA dioxygenase family protein [Elusimicrobiota bacterium]
MAGETFLSRQGYEKLRQDLAGLKERRQNLAREIGEAAEKGDLRENAEYHAAKEEQQKVVRRIDDLEAKLRNSRIIEEMNVQAGEVRIGCSVRIREAKSGEEFKYTLVDATEANGCLWIMPGSHRNPVVRHRLHESGKYLEIAKEDLPQGEAVACPVPK